MRYIFRQLLPFTIFIFLFLSAPLFAFESGMASWYGGKFQGRKTANGEIFDTNELTAAHKTLPFNTVVRVTNLKNSKTVIVRINDRGPFVAGRVIDLSHAAAEAIDMAVSGVALVELEIVSLPEGFTETSLVKTESVHPEGIPDSYKIQVASFSRAENASKCLKKLIDAGIQAEIEVSTSGMMRVIVPTVEKGDIERIKNLLSGIGFNTPLIRHN